MTDRTRTALIIGASRGLGLGLAKRFAARGWSVVATTRGSNDNGLHALAKRLGATIRIESLDVTKAQQIEALKAKLADTPIDVLFVSAGVNDTQGSTIDKAGLDTFEHLMATNAFAPLKLIEAFGDRVSDDGAIVAMTSVLGSVAGNTSGGYEVYRASKAALNTLLRSYSARHKTRCVIAMHPGWVRTDMGGANADVAIEDSAAGMVEVVEGRRGQAGCVFLDYKGDIIPW